MKDDESTQQIDVDALRGTASQGPATSKPSTEKSAPPSELDDPPTVSRASRPSFDDFNEPSEASVTKIELAPPVAMPDDHATTGAHEPAPSWMTHRDLAFHDTTHHGSPHSAEPGTIPAHSIVKAMVAEMGHVEDDVEDLEELET